MKMTNERYAQLVALLDGALAERNMTFDVVRAATLAHGKARDLQLAAAWYTLHMATNDNIHYRFVLDCYDEGLNDDHIGTALLAWAKGCKPKDFNKPVASRKITIKAPAKEGTIEITGMAVTISAQGQPIRCLIHDDKLTHRPSGLILTRSLGEYRLSLRLHHRLPKPSPKQTAQFAVDSLIMRVGLEKFLATLASAPVINA